MVYVLSTEIATTPRGSYVNKPEQLQHMARQVAALMVRLGGEAHVRAEAGDVVIETVKGDRGWVILATVGDRLVGDLSGQVVSEEDTETLWHAALEFNSAAEVEGERALAEIEALRPPDGVT